MAGDIVAPVAGETTLTLRAQGCRELTQDMATHQRIVTGDFLRPDPHESRQVA
ncbi:MAG: hypothetical protein KDJ18_05925 [Hyphomicrobiaceae bacterium]|nr:hypothetical protein [Hyphomicrobiaceae bacterium]